MTTPEPHRVWSTFPAFLVLYLTNACYEAELAARDGGVDVVQVSGADRPPGSITEDLKGAGGKAVDVHSAYQPHCPLLPCRRRGLHNLMYMSSAPLLT